MKHESAVTWILIIIFAISQFVGLALVGRSLDYTCQMVSDSEEICGVISKDTVLGEPLPHSGVGGLLYIMIGVGVGTLLLLLIIKFGRRKLWKLWFFMAVWLTVSVALGSFVPDAVAYSIAFILALWKIFKPNMIIYNLAEILMYAGMAVLLAPILYVPEQTSELMSIWPALVLLGAISIYDMIAVWKSKHMVKMAKFITSSNSFAGLVVPYKTKEKQVTLEMPKGSALPKGHNLTSESSHKNAILGGGDITFPLLFGGTILQSRTIEMVRAGIDFQVAATQGFFSVLPIAAGATLAIAGLFFFAKKDRFYPAMPFVTAGCLIGWAITLLI